MLTPRVSVIVPLFNGKGLIAACLESIDDSAEIIVVDDCSTDGAPELVAQRFPNVKLLRNDSNVGFGTTSNRGLIEATGTVRVVLNSDARLQPGALKRLVAAFDDPEVGVAGGRRLFPDGSHQTSAARFPTPGSIITGSFLLNEVYRWVRPSGRFPFELGMAKRDHAHDHEVDWVSGTCIALRDGCLADTGGFDENYYLYGEETDLCWRAGQAGWQVKYVAGARVVHLGGGSTGDPSVHARRFIASEGRFMVRAYGLGGWRRWRAARVLGSAIKSVVLVVPAAFSRRVRTRWRWQAAALVAAVRAAPCR